MIDLESPKPLQKKKQFNYCIVNLFQRFSQPVFFSSFPSIGIKDAFRNRDNREKNLQLLSQSTIDIELTRPFHINCESCKYK